ncbi:MAG: lipoate--protein ligase family protein [Pirellulales bacterium]
MHLFDLTLPTPQENLALDEALLEHAEASDPPCEMLRIWESRETFVVLGRSSQAALEANLEFCRRQGICVLRRTSGGAAVVVAPGALMYAVVLSYEVRPALHSLDEAHRFVLQTTLAALAPLMPQATHQGICDLTLGEQKFSGNSVRCKQRSLLYHGTLLYGMDLSLVEQYLQMPSRQPDYRRNRPHGSFITNAPADAAALRRALIAGWRATPAPFDWPRQRVRQLVLERYHRDEWNLQR